MDFRPDNNHCSDKATHIEKKWPWEKLRGNNSISLERMHILILNNELP